MNDYRLDSNDDGHGGVLALLDRHRPAPDAYETEWSEQQRTAAMSTILRTPAEAHQRSSWIRRHRRSTIAGALAAAAVAATVTAGLLAPTGTPGGPDSAAAATLERLAATAEQSGPIVGPHQYAYVREQSEQTLAAGEQPVPGHTRRGRMDVETTRTWTATNGDVWLYRALGPQASCLSHRSYTASPRGVNAYGNLNSAGLATLPIDSDRLADYLSAHPAGDNRGANNVFGSVADLVRSGLASPRLRAAAIRVLAHTSGITVRTGARDAAGRNATQVDKKFRYGVETLFFDPTSSLLLEEQTTQGDFLYRSLIRESGVVDHVPTGLARCPKPTHRPG